MKCSRPHFNSYRQRECSVVVALLKWLSGINLAQKSTRPSKDRTSVAFSVSLALLMAVILSYAGDKPSFEIMCPMNFARLKSNAHFEGLTVSPRSSNHCKTRINLCSASDLP